MDNNIQRDVIDGGYKVGLNLCGRGLLLVAGFGELSSFIEGE
jgi:hypothetical protein